MNSKMNPNSNNNSKKRESVFPCKLWPKNVSDNDYTISYDLCQKWVHIKCNHINFIEYKYLQGCNEPWYCLNTLFLFGNLNIQNFLTFIGDNTMNETKILNSSLPLKPPQDLALLFNQFNNIILENHRDPQNAI